MAQVCFASFSTGAPFTSVAGDWSRAAVDPEREHATRAKIRIFGDLWRFFDGLSHEYTAEDILASNADAWRLQNPADGRAASKDMHAERTISATGNEKYKLVSDISMISCLSDVGDDATEMR